MTKHFEAITESDIEYIVDEMATLQRQFKPLVDRFEELKKLLSEYANNQADDENLFLTSENNYIEYSKPAKSLVCKVGAEKFLELTECYDAINISVAVAKEQLDKELLNELFEYKTGSRRLLKIVPIVSD